jgi:prophage antirepressor-like protein
MNSLDPIRDIFKYKNKNLKIVSLNNEYWFCGKDIAQILEYKKLTNSIKIHIKDKHKIMLKDLYNKFNILNPIYKNKYEKKMIYISESGLYKLILKSNMKEAENFQDWIVEEVLPSIRKNGYYIKSNINDKQIEKLKQEIDENKKQLEEKDAQLNRLHNIQKELITYKKKFSKEETIYIVSTANYARQGIFKVGRTKNSMKFRSSSHNTTHISGDKVKVLHKFKVNDCVIVERIIHNKLQGLVLRGEKEFFKCPYDLLVSIVDCIVHNDDEANELVNKIIDTVYRLKNAAFRSEDWTSGIPKDMFKETLTINDNTKPLIEFDISLWTEKNKKDFVEKCLEQYIQQQNKVNQDYELVWKSFQVYLRDQLKIPKSKFKVRDWKDAVRNQIQKKDKLSIKWRN